jgi:hypothetical protein
MYLQCINSDKHLPQSPFTCNFFGMTTFCFIQHNDSPFMQNCTYLFRGSEICFFYVIYCMYLQIRICSISCMQLTPEHAGHMYVIRYFDIAVSIFRKKHYNITLCNNSILPCTVDAAIQFFSTFSLLPI